MLVLLCFCVATEFSVKKKDFFIQSVIGFRLSFRPSVCPVDRQQQRHAAGLLLNASTCSGHRSTLQLRRRRSAADAGSVMPRAEDEDRHRRVKGGSATGERQPRVV